MENLFIYGTLMDPEVQLREIGRILNAEEDFLEDYKKSDIEINGEVYPLIIPSQNSSVKGLLISLTDSELKRTDEYEEIGHSDAYKRILVRLKSGTKAWAYVSGKL